MGKQRKDGSGSIYQQKADGRWVAQVRIHDPIAGRSRLVRRYAKSKTGAERALKALRSEALAPTGADITVVDYLQQWARTTLKVSGRAEKTVEQYTTLITSPIIPTMGALKLSDVNAAHVEAWLVRLDEFRYTRSRKPGAKAYPLAQSTKRSAFAVLSLAFDTAVRDGLLVSNPCAQVRRPGKDDSVEVPVMTADEVDQLLEVARGDEQWGPLVELLANTGLRISEALGLKWSQVDLEARTLTVLKTKTGAKGRRTIPLTDEAVAALHRQRSWQRRTRLLVGSGWRRSGLVFTTGVGTVVDPHNARRAQRRLLIAAGLPTNRPFHTMRHSLATRLLRQGVPMPIVSAILGHSSIRTTVDTYGHFEAPISPEDLQAVMDASRGPGAAGVAR